MLLKRKGRKEQKSSIANSKGQHEMMVETVINLKRIYLNGNLKG